MRMRLIGIGFIALLTLVVTAPATIAIDPDEGFEIHVHLEDLPGTPDAFRAAAAYLYELPSGARWVAGDRSAYTCAYTFLVYNGQTVGRAAFFRVDAAQAYAQINDKFMEEGVRYYNGERNTDPGLHDTGTEGLSNTSTWDACNGPSAFALQSYSPFTGQPGFRPVITFDHATGGTLETRNYANVVQVPANHFRFQFIQASPSRVVVGYFHEGLPVAVVYYDSLASNVTLGSNAPADLPPPPDSGTHASTVGLRLIGHLRASGAVRVADGTSECILGRTVHVERRVHGHWATVGTDQTSASGRYAVHLRDRAGTYRARVTQETLASGEVCTSDRSRPRVNH